ncbi:MAG: metal ABC transporter ATP-binding protein [Tissierellia bacterium]|nr:metal ABC transporter ATP-binding protein [Tissierellia bacterium]
MGKRIVMGKDIEFSYGDNKVLDGVSFHIDEGEFVGIIGPNGSAKSTLLKLMLGLLKPDKGKMELFGERADSFSDFHKLGYISQEVRDFNPMFPATVEEIVGVNLAARKGLFKKRKLRDDARIKEVLRVVGMDGFGKSKIGNLSGGQKQRVFIARALANNPTALFMDEPLVGVDQESRDTFYKLMNILNREYGISLVMVSHDIEVLSEQVSRTIRLNDGRIHSGQDGG